MFKEFALALAAALPFSNANPVPNNPYDAVCHKWPPAADGLKVDLGYGVYEGYHSSTTDLNVWQGIRFAAAPLGGRRFRAPEVPPTNRRPQNATAAAPICPQSAPALSSPEIQQLFTLNDPQSEDCLFLNVYAPENADNLPVFVWVHGGGYELGAITPYDPSSLINTNKQDFVAVVIQYRLGAFGFLSSEEVRHKGALNAGLLDQQMTLQWVQKYIGLFGGDASRVTLAGESAGAGSVMNHIIAYGGAQGDHLFSNAITASPFLPQYFEYDAPEVVNTYREFAKLAGCANKDSAVFECLQAAPSDTLVSANEEIASAALVGIFEFKPVVDGALIKQRPSQALKGHMNGKRLLTGNNANEGYLFIPQNITTSDDVVDFLRTYFPRLTDNDITAILDVYPTPDVPDSPSTPKFPTTGDHPPTAVNQSELAIGHQQVANAIYGEITFACASYWLASAFAKQGRDSFQYQFSVTPAFHGMDILYYFPTPAFPVAASVQTALQSAFGAFVTEDAPPAGWPRYELSEPRMRNVNATGGTPFEALGLTFYVDPGVELDERTVRADEWEGGRAERCEVLRGLGERLVI